jgi:hypothetical protein
LAETDRAVRHAAVNATPPTIDAAVRRTINQSFLICVRARCYRRRRQHRAREVGIGVSNMGRRNQFTLSRMSEVRICIVARQCSPEAKRSAATAAAGTGSLGQ